MVQSASEGHGLQVTFFVWIAGFVTAPEEDFLMCSGTENCCDSVDLVLGS